MKYKILVVDDDKELVKMLCSYFNMKQYETITATDGMEALNKIKMKPDIILLDINMPHMDGIEVCRLIRSKVLCPILFLTTSIRKNIRVKIVPISWAITIDPIRPFDNWPFLVETILKIAKNSIKRINSVDKTIDELSKI